ncbi:hypothetical protein QBC45DRAFT_415773 [Copromyces sp. CBS 386.78]|nr:hypothetical protein QBC45DRAFT_415773 [Copromyces sp. CBS 386.78]
MHAGNTFGNIREDVEDLGLGQTVLQPGVHEVDKTAAIAVFHQEEDLVAAGATHLRGMRIDIGDDGLVALEALHGLDLGAHAAEGLLVRHGDPLEHGQVGAIDRRRQLDQIDMCKTAFGKVLLDDNSVGAALDLGAGRKGACWGSRGADRHGSPVRCSIRTRPRGSRRHRLSKRSHRAGCELAYKLLGSYGSIRLGSGWWAICRARRIGRVTLGRRTRWCLGSRGARRGAVVWGYRWVGDSTESWTALHGIETMQSKEGEAV